MIYASSPQICCDLKESGSTRDIPFTDQVFARYKACYAFEAQEPEEISIDIGDVLLVAYRQGLENEQIEWLEGQNERTGEFGEIPGSFVEFAGLTYEQKPRAPPPTLPKPTFLKKPTYRKYTPKRGLFSLSTELSYLY